MTRRPTPRPRLRTGLLALALAAAGMGCDRDAVLSAGRTRVSAEEARAYLARRSGADVDAAVAELGTRALLAEAGRRAGLADDPAVKARIAAARREILAQVFLDRELAPAEREDGLRKRYEARKDALARRRVHVAHVAVHLGPGGREAAQSKATRAYARLAGGEPIEKVAREMSEDPVTAPRGGDLGPLLEGEVDRAFFEAAAALAQGEFSRPVETPYGFHVLEALAPVEKVVPSFEDVRAVLAAEARREAEASLMERLRGEIGLEVREERVRTLAGAPGPRPGGGT